MMTTMTTEKRKTKTNLFDNFYAILLPHKTKKLSDTYFISWRQKKFTVKTELSPPPWSFPTHSASQIERERGREKRKKKKNPCLLLPSFPSAEIEFQRHQILQREQGFKLQATTTSGLRIAGNGFGSDKRRGPREIAIAQESEASDDGASPSTSMP